MHSCVYAFARSSMICTALAYFNNVWVMVTIRLRIWIRLVVAIKGIKVKS